MAQILGTPVTISSGSVTPVKLPENLQPTPILQQSSATLIQEQQSGSSVVSYKFKSTELDPTPGYLINKIGDQFTLSNYKLVLDNFGSLTTDDLTVGSTNLFFSEDQFNTLIAGLTSDSVAEGSSNIYYSNDLVSANTDVTANTAARHSHSNKAILDNITAAFTTTLKTTYDGYVSNVVLAATNPITFVDQTIAHSTSVGYKHVPDDTGVPEGYVLSKGSSLGTYTWIAQSSGTSITLDSTPTTSTASAVQSAWIKNHNENLLTDVLHITGDEYTYLTSTIPTHIADLLLHVPEFTTSDASKYLKIDATGTSLEFGDVDTSLSITGESYISIDGTTITASKISLSQTELIAGDNITFDTNTISAVQRAIDDSPTNGSVDVCISSNWAYDHYTNYGSGGHIPTGGTSDQYIGGDGEIHDFTSAPGQAFTITLGSGGTSGDISTRLASGDTSYPDGWSLAVGSPTTDLVVTHSLSTAVIGVDVFADDGSTITKLISSAAYSTVKRNSAETVLTIASLATINQKIYIYVKFL